MVERERLRDARYLLGRVLWFAKSPPPPAYYNLPGHIQITSVYRGFSEKKRDE